MRERYAPSPVDIALALLLTLFALLLVASPAAAGWNPDGVTITPTTASIPIVEACSDGRYGTFVAWQEESSSGQGVLRVQHVLPTGDLDSVWPAAGAIACAVLAPRSEVVALPDHLGGLYLLWKEATSLYAIRINPDGSAGSGWPARGRKLGTVYPDSPRPSVIEDGASGFYAAWVSDGFPSAIGTHLGPSNTGAGGWPNGTRTVGPSTEVPSTPFWPQLALAPDGGVFVAFAFSSTDEVAVPSAYRVRRLTSAGFVAAGWSAQGVDIAPFHCEHLTAGANSALVALSPDGRGGVFLTQGDLRQGGPNEYDPPLLEMRLHRLQENGQPDADWPSVAPAVTDEGPYFAIGSEGDCRVFTDGTDGAYSGAPVYFGHGGYFAMTHFLAQGQRDVPNTPSLVQALSGYPSGNEFVSAPQGRLLSRASFHGGGPTNPYDSGAYISASVVSPVSSAGWSENHWEPMLNWYGDIGLASSGDGAAVFFWSQVRERIGLFARRITGGGEVTGVPPSVGASLSLSGLRFVPGSGVRGLLRIPVGATARLTLHDVAGRRIMSEAIEGGARDHTLQDTATLPSGLYFARLTSGGENVGAKVFVAR